MGDDPPNRPGPRGVPAQGCAADRGEVAPEASG